MFLRTPWDLPGLQEALRAAAAEGLTAGQIAARLNGAFGMDLTRCSVIGRMRRTGLQLYRLPNRREDAPPKPKRSYNRRIATLPLPKPYVPPPPPPDEPIPLGDVDGGCRWPHGEPTDRNFCGAPLSGATSWCAHHRARVLVTVKAEAA